MNITKTCSRCGQQFTLSTDDPVPLCDRCILAQDDSDPEEEKLDISLSDLATVLASIDNKKNK